jgi:hypothetical protein
MALYLHLLNPVHKAGEEADGLLDPVKPRQLNPVRWKSKDDVCGDQVRMGREQVEHGEGQKTMRGRRPVSWLSGEVYMMLQSLGRERMSM